MGFVGAVFAALLSCHAAAVDFAVRFYLLDHKASLKKLILHPLENICRGVHG